MGAQMSEPKEFKEMTDEELIRKLRGESVTSGYVRLEAADRLEQRNAEIAELRTLPCPECQEFRRRGTEEPLIVLERQMLINNIWSNIVTEVLGFERAQEIAAKVEAIANEALKKMEN